MRKIIAFMFLGVVSIGYLSLSAQTINTYVSNSANVKQGQWVH